VIEQLAPMRTSTTASIKSPDIRPAGCASVSDVELDDVPAPDEPWKSIEAQAAGVKKADAANEATRTAAIRRGRLPNMWSGIGSRADVDNRRHPNE
jgi:hypothetical protein